MLSMRLYLSGWELEKMFLLLVFTPILFSICSIAPQQVRLGRSCLGFYEAHLIECFSWHFFLIGLEVSNSRHLRCVDTQLFLSVARVCSSTKFLMPSISNKSFSGACLTVLKDIEVIFEILLNNSFAKNFLMQLQV